MLLNTVPEGIASSSIVPEALAHQRAQAVEAFAEISGGAVRPDGDLPGGADHPRIRSTAMRAL